MSLGDVVERARREGFVGRRSELTSFDSALAGRSTHRVLFVSGPGGIGKTTLLMEMRGRARAAGRSVALLDGREVDPSPEGFRTALRAAGGEPGVVFVDGYEHLGAIDGWLRRDLIPALGADDVMVLAGREPPGAAWRADPGWRRVVAFHRLDYLDDSESSDLLARAGVDGAARDRLLPLGKGHPLALALLADAAAAGTVPDRLADVPDLIAALMESLLREAPTQAHTTGLATCAKVWLTTEDLLRDTVGDLQFPVQRRRVVLQDHLHLPRLERAHLAPLRVGRHVEIRARGIFGAVPGLHREDEDLRVRVPHRLARTVHVHATPV